VPDATRPSTPTGPPRHATDAPVKMFKALPEGASVEQLCFAQNEMSVALANALATANQELPAIRTVMSEVRVELEANRLESKRVDTKLDELGLGIAGVAYDVKHVSGRVSALEVIMADMASARMVAANPKLSPLPPPNTPPSVPPMRRQMDSTAFLVETARRVGEAAKIKAQQIIDTPNVDLTSDAVGDIARTEAREELARERETSRIEALQALADKVEADRLEAVELKKKKAEEKRERNRLIVVGVVVGVIMMLLEGLFLFGQGRATGHGEGFAERAAIMPPTLVPVYIPAGSGSAVEMYSSPAMMTGATAPVVAPAAAKK
jgi:hypothetical protein